jgi:uncharacterized OB-fold protein
MNSNTIPAVVPVAEGLIDVSGAVASLIGSRCTGCGSHYFPQALSCRNPDCDRKVLEAAHIGREGRLYGWTLQAYRPPALFRMDDWEPYALGLVELPEGLRVLSMLTGCSVDDLHVDMALELVVETLYVDDSGHDVLTYKYAPAAKNGAVA